MTDLRAAREAARPVTREELRAAIKSALVSAYKGDLGGMTAINRRADEVLMDADRYAAGRIAAESGTADAPPPDPEEPRPRRRATRKAAGT